MIFLLSLLAQGAATVDPAHVNQAIASAKAASNADMEVQIAHAPAGVTLPLAVETVITTDRDGAVAGCAPLHSRAPAVFGDLACQQVKALAHFPVTTDEYGKPTGAIRKVTVSFNTAH